MTSIQFNGGPLDGCALSVGDKIPDRIEIVTRFDDLDVESPDAMEALKVNLEAEPDQMIVAKNLTSMATVYEIDEDESGPFYRCVGWRAEGTSRKTP